MNVDEGMSQSTTNVRITCIAMRVCHTLTKKILEAHYSDDGASERGRIKGGFTLSPTPSISDPLSNSFTVYFTW